MKDFVFGILDENQRQKTIWPLNVIEPFKRRFSDNERASQEQTTSQQKTTVKSERSLICKTKFYSADANLPLVGENTNYRPAW